MKHISFGLLGSLILLTNCQTNPANPTADDCVGSSGYHIKNESDYLFSVTSVTTPQGNEKSDVSQMIANQQAGKITQVTNFDYIAKPTHTFTSRILYREIDGKKLIVYRKNPLNGKGWVKQK